MTYKKAGDISEAVDERFMSGYYYCGYAECEPYMDRRMLIMRSPLQPVMNPAAAGGKRKATWQVSWGSLL